MDDYLRNITEDYYRGKLLDRDDHLLAHDINLRQMIFAKKFGHLFAQGRMETRGFVRLPLLIEVRHTQRRSQILLTAHADPLIAIDGHLSQPSLESIFEDRAIVQFVLKAEVIDILINDQI